MKWKLKSISVGEKGEEKVSRFFSGVLVHIPFYMSCVINLCIIIFTLHLPI